MSTTMAEPKMEEEKEPPGYSVPVNVVNNIQLTDLL